METHFTFKNYSIDCTPEEMSSNLSTCGFVEEHNGPEGIFMSGTFAGVTNCTIALSKTRIGVLSSVAVLLPSRVSWWQLKSDYTMFKDMLRKKYGYPSQAHESFDSPYYEGDGYELSAIRNGKGRYMSTFETQNGKVNIIISSDRLMVFYVDKINEKREEDIRKINAFDDI